MAAIDYSGTFATRLEELRKRDNLTIAELADRLFLSTRTIDYYLQGKRLPSIDIAFQVAGYFSVSIDYLFLEDNGKMNPYSMNVIDELLKLNRKEQIETIHKKQFSDSPTAFAAKKTELQDLKEHFEDLFGTGKNSVHYRYVRDICVKYCENRRALQTELW